MGVVMRLFVLGLAMLIGTAVWSTDAGAKELKTSDGRPVTNVAVISRLGDRFQLVLEESRVLGRNTIRRGDALAPDWKVDEHIERRIGQALSARFKVAAPMPDELASRGADVWGTDDMAENFRKLAPRPDIDAYVLVVTAIDSEDFYPTDTVLVPIWGLGLYHLTGFLPDGTWVFAVFDVVILDAKTGQEIARQRGRTAGEWNYASDIADDRLWPNEADKPLRPEQIPPIRDAITALVDKSVDWTLRKMELVR
jgi:hypothetical protein